MTKENTPFKKGESYLVIYEFDPSKIQVDNCLVWRDQRNLRDIKAISSKYCLTQHKPLVCDFRIMIVKVTKIKLLL